MEIRYWEAPDLPFDRGEIARYASLAGAADMPAELDRCLAEVRGKVCCRCVWRLYPAEGEEGMLDLGFARTESRSLSLFLKDCRQIVLFAMTAGFEMDRLIARASLRSPLEGLLTHAIGAERVETACDRFCRDLPELLKNEIPGVTVKGRFSPGYGDLPLALQKDVFSALDCGRRLGLTLQDSLLMIPSKSVTAIVGLRTS